MSVACNPASRSALPPAPVLAPGVYPQPVRGQNRLVRGAIAAVMAVMTVLLAATLLLGLPQRAWAGLPLGNAVTDGYALLRYALPIQSAEIREVQTPLELLANDLRAKRWAGVNKAVQKVGRVLAVRSSAILQAVPEVHQAEATTLLDTIKADLPPLEGAIAAKDREQVWTERGKLLRTIGQLEELMVSDFAFAVPEEYRNLPQLHGRATVELTTTKGKMIAIVDGYNAPLTAGNFVDLVQRGFYDGLPFIRPEGAYVVQSGDPAGPATGFVDPKTQQMRTVPLEIRVVGEEKTLYGTTFEDAGLFTGQPTLPFSAFGTLGMARPGSDLDGGSSQFFFFLFEPELTPAGANLIDGRYAAFGYVVENKKLLDEIRQGDKILSAKVIAGAENLVVP